MRTISDELREEADEAGCEYPGYFEGYRDGAKAERERTAAALRLRGFWEGEIKAILGQH